jgi:hypothetical protein
LQWPGLPNGFKDSFREKDPVFQDFGQEVSILLLFFVEERLTGGGTEKSVAGLLSLFLLYFQFLIVMRW